MKDGTGHDRAVGESFPPASIPHGMRVPIEQFREISELEPFMHFRADLPPLLHKAYEEVAPKPMIYQEKVAGCGGM
jgi:hypothetical protein